MSDVQARRRFFAEEVEITANLKSATLVAALASVPREGFLPPGPWTIRSEADFMAPPRQTPDADPRRVYHNVAVAIDPARQLFNGTPGLLAMVIDALAPQRGERLLHVGTGLGYYTAIMAECVAPSGRVLGIEVDEDLARASRANLSAWPGVELRHGNAAGPFGETFDAIFVNAGVTHPLDTWLDALAPGGRLMLPLTVAMAGTPIGKGPMLLITRGQDPAVWAARMVTFVAIYSALGIRDDANAAVLGKAMSARPFAPCKSLRRDAHDADATCWVHLPGCCFSINP